MNTFNHYTFDSISHLTDAMNDYPEAGIDPALDAECEELESEFQGLRFSQTLDRN